MVTEIIQEKPGLEGFCISNNIKSPIRIRVGNQEPIAKIKIPQWVIWVDFRNRDSYPIVYFPSKHHRDEAYRDLISCKEEQFVLSLEKYFWKETKEIEIVVQQIKDQRHHMKGFIRIMYENVFRSSLALMGTSDAFRNIDLASISRCINANQRIYIPSPEETSLLWAKSLPTPKDIRKFGITPLQYYRTLIKINNEDFRI